MINGINGKIPNVSDLGKKTPDEAIIKETLLLLIALILIILQKELVNKSNISGFINGSDLNKKIETLATIAGLKGEQSKIVKLEIYDLRYFLDENVFKDDGSQNMFVS